MDSKQLTEQIKVMVSTDESKAVDMLTLLHLGDEQKAQEQLAEIKKEIELDKKRKVCEEKGNEINALLQSFIAEKLPSADDESLNDFSRVYLTIALQRKTTKDKESGVETVTNSWTTGVQISPVGEKVGKSTSTANSGNGGKGADDAPAGYDGWASFVRSTAPETAAKYEGKSINMRNVATSLQKKGYYDSDWNVIGTE